MPPSSVPAPDANIFTYRLVGGLTLERSKGVSLETPLDKAMPFLPELTVVYMSIYFMWLPIVFSPDVSVEYFKDMAKATLWAFGIMYFYYLILPSSYPRPNLDECECWAHAPLRWLYAVDLPNNTFPSSHSAGVAILLAASEKKLSGLSKFLYFTWGMLIIISTFAIKQHYIADTVSGVAVGILRGSFGGYRMQPETSTRPLLFKNANFAFLIFNTTVPSWSVLYINNRHHQPRQGRWRRMAITFCRPQS